ncbi:hypothetical protein CP532_2280 [Ophiocordyceps camponoti-leonardi (nom. inval.)]|nr:hypothetical protein CP532_2280 [Ophiocordyceps camponoti-leonardi (nom. inval.)]
MANSKFEYVRAFEQTDALLPNTWIVIRLDGRAFTKMCAKYKFTKPNDRRALDLMNAAAKAVVSDLPEITIGYGVSDEYSFVFHKTCNLFERRASKLISTVVSTFTANYIYNWPTYFPDTPLSFPLPTFDGRAVCYPSVENLRDYLSWRQVDCHINNLYNTTFWSLVQLGGLENKDAEKALAGTVASDKNEILFSRFQINYNNEPEMFRKGSVVFRDTDCESQESQSINATDYTIKTKTSRALRCFQPLDLNKMSPLCADPRQVVIALDVPQRSTLLELVQDIISYMISQLEVPAEKQETEIPEKSEGEDDDINKAQKPMTAKEAKTIQEAAVENLRKWRDDFLPKLREIVQVKDTSAIEAERQARREKQEGDDKDPDAETDDLALLRSLYCPIPTPLTDLPVQDRREALTSVLLLLLSTGKYPAHSRVLILHLASALNIPASFVDEQEGEIAKSLLDSSSSSTAQQGMSADAEAAKRKEDNKLSRYWKVGLASVAGAAVIGVTGGLAAPLVAGALSGIMGGVGLGGVASFLAIFWANGALVGALFGAYGAKMTGEMMDSYAKEVEDFRFIPLNNAPEAPHKLRLTIGINGWLASEDDITKPWKVLGPESEAFALRYEMKTLLSLGSALNDLVQSLAWKTLKRELVKRTALATLLAALWPVQVLAMASTSIDNPFQRARHRSRKAGRLLADALVNRVQGERPVSLVGYSLGAAAIHACLQELADRRAFGIVDSVVLIGAPAPADTQHWRALRPVVAGTIFNVFSENDLVLGLVYRLHALDYGVAGLQPITDVPALRNSDLSAAVTGHLRYPLLTADILARCGFAVRPVEDATQEQVDSSDTSAPGEQLAKEITDAQGETQ